MTDAPAAPWTPLSDDALRTWVGPVVTAAQRFYGLLRRVFTVLALGSVVVAGIVWFAQPWTWPHDAGGAGSSDTAARVVGGLALLVAFLIPAIAAAWARSRSRVAAVIEPGAVIAELQSMMASTGSMADQIVRLTREAGEGGTVRKLKALNELRGAKDLATDHIASLELSSVRRLGTIGRPSFQLASATALIGSALLVVAVLPAALLT